MCTVEAVIGKIEYKDILEVKNVLKESKAVMADNISGEVLRHIREGVALKLVSDGMIVGVWCSIDMGEYISLSYFYVDPMFRRTMWLLEFFLTASSSLEKGKHVVIAAKDTEGFDKYVEKIGEDLYRFKGVR